MLDLMYCEILNYILVGHHVEKVEKHFCLEINNFIIKEGSLSRSRGEVLYNCTSEYNSLL
jgi:hypothetical protein